MILFKDFTQLDQNEVEMVFSWRNDERINRFFIHHVVAHNEHLDFIKHLKKDKSKRYFLVYDDEKAIGVVNFVDIHKDECEFGLYQNPDLKGYGKILLSNLMRYAFETLGVKTLKARAFKDNEKACALYLKSGFSLVRQDDVMGYFSIGGGA